MGKVWIPRQLFGLFWRRIQVAKVANLKFVMNKTGKGRSAIFETLEHMETLGKLYRDKGRYWLAKPAAKQKGLISQLSDALERRARRKRLEREKKEHDRIIPVIAYYRHRAEDDGVDFYKKIVDEYDKESKTFEPESEKS
jgi:hypothetical protein